MFDFQLMDDVAIVSSVNGLFEQFALGVFLVGQTGDKTGNSVARDLLVNLPLLTIEDGKLRARDRTDNKALKSALAEVVQQKRRRWLAIGGHAQDRLFMTILPFSMHPFQAIICAAPPANENGVSTEMLAVWLDLTPKQAELAANIAKGMALDESADAMGVSVGTARTHLKHIFMKTGCTSQAQLVAMSRTAPFL